MGTYLNLGSQNFREFVDTGLYVDKTMLIDLTNSRLSDPTFRFVCVSRPRRFGKSIASDMLAAYYSKGADSRESTSVTAIPLPTAFSGSSRRKARPSSS